MVSKFFALVLLLRRLHKDRSSQTRNTDASVSPGTLSNNLQKRVRTACRCLHCTNFNSPRRARVQWLPLSRHRLSLSGHAIGYLVAGIYKYRMEDKLLPGKIGHVWGRSLIVILASSVDDDGHRRKRLGGASPVGPAQILAKDFTFVALDATMQN